jgi:hypothetical protein
MVVACGLALTVIGLIMWPFIALVVGLFGAIL